MGLGSLGSDYNYTGTKSVPPGYQKGTTRVLSGHFEVAIRVLEGYNT